METINAAKCVSSRNLIAFLSIQEGAQKTRSTFERIVLLKTTGALNFLPFALNCSGSISMATFVTMNITVLLSLIRSWYLFGRIDY